MAAKKFYAVKQGRNPGIYQTWDECKQQVDGFAGAQFKGFATLEEARQYVYGTSPDKEPLNGPQAAVEINKVPSVPENTVIIFTDGSCLKNPGGPGGFAAIIKSGNDVYEISGGEESTTNNRMEMRAALEALRMIKEPARITLFTDSQYLKNGFTRGWLRNWKKNGWITKAGGSVLNIDLWQEIDRFTTFHDITWQFVKGHNGQEENERCDQLSKKEAGEIAARIGFFKRNTAH